MSSLQAIGICSAAGIFRCVARPVFLFFLGLLSVTILSGLTFSGKGECYRFSSFCETASLSVQNSENSSSAYRGDQLKLLQNILRSLRSGQQSASKKGEFPPDLSLVFSLLPIIPAEGTLNGVTNFTLRIYLKSSLPVRAGPFCA